MCVCLGGGGGEGVELGWRIFEYYSQWILKTICPNGFLKLFAPGASEKFLMHWINIETKIHPHGEY